MFCVSLCQSKNIGSPDHDQGQQGSLPGFHAIHHRFVLKTIVNISSRLVSRLNVCRQCSSYGLEIQIMAFTSAQMCGCCKTGTTVQGGSFTKIPFHFAFIYHALKHTNNQLTLLESRLFFRIRYEELLQRYTLQT